MSGAKLDGQTDVLEALDWQPEVLCDWAPDHGVNPAVWRVIASCCGFTVLGCEECRRNWLSHVAVCKECAPGGKGRCCTCHKCKAVSRHDEARWEPIK